MERSPKSKIISRKTEVRLERERKQRKILIVSAIVVAVAIVGVIAAGLLDRYVFQQNKAVAMVDNQPITMRDFQVRVRYTRWQLIQRYINTAQYSQLFAGDQNFADYYNKQLEQITTQLQDPAVLGQSVLDELIEQAAVVQEAQRRGITVSEDELEKKMQEAFGFFKNGTPTPQNTATPFSTPTYSSTQLAIVTLAPTATAEPTATATLAPTEPAVPATPTVVQTPTSTATPYTLEGYQQTVKDYITKEPPKTDISEADLRQVIHSQLLRQKVIDAVTADVKREEDRVWARHMLVKDEAAAQAVLQELKAGGDWSKITADVSLDSSNKLTGGDLGWFGPGKMVSEFEKAAFALQVGEISQPVKTQFGYHIIQSLGHEVRLLTASEYEEARQAKYKDWLTAATAKEKVQRYDDFWKKIVPTEPVLNPNMLGQ